MGAGREFQFLEVMCLLVNEMVRHFSNLTAKECWESVKRVLCAKHDLGRITDFNSSEPLAPTKSLKCFHFFLYFLFILKYQFQDRGRNIISIYNLISLIKNIHISSPRIIRVEIVAEKTL